MTNFDRTKLWLSACGKRPSKENLSIQIGCDIEEAAEFLREVDFDADPDTAVRLRRIILRAVEDLEFVATKIKKGEHTAILGNYERALDALCDREVTGNGVAYLAGFDKRGADQAVLASNDAKLVDGKPVILPGGKIGKPEGWKAPDLSGFV